MNIESVGLRRALQLRRIGCRQFNGMPCAGKVRDGKDRSVLV